MATASVCDHAKANAGDRIGFLGAFESPALESAFRQRCFRDDRWVSIFLVAAVMVRVSLLLLADYASFGVARQFWLLLAIRVLFDVVSIAVLISLRRAVSPVSADRLFFAWAALVVALAVFALSSRPPSNPRLLLMSFAMIAIGYCVMPLPLSRQAILAMSFSAAALYVSRHAGAETFSTVGAAYVMSHVFGIAMSGRLNRRRREMFLGALREERLRADLEAALAEVRTLRGILYMCAWCKRIRDEGEVWEPVDKYVQTRTDASFSHGICPDCFQAQIGEMPLATGASFCPAHS